MIRTNSLRLLVFGAAALHGAAAPNSTKLLSPGESPVFYTAMLGGAAQIHAIAVDAQGNAYVTGVANSPIPVTPGAFQTSYQPGSCLFWDPEGPKTPLPCPVAFAAKLNSTGDRLLYATYLGASNSSGSAIAIDKDGNTWITGTVSSTDLPITGNAPQSSRKGNSDAFVLELDSSGSRYLFSTYLGGSGDEMQPIIAADAESGNIYAAGLTSSSDFPVTAGAFQTIAPALQGPNASYVVTFRPTGEVVYSSYFRGNESSGVAVTSIGAGPNGTVLLAGSQSGGGLPVTDRALQTAPLFYDSGFVAEFSPDGSSLVYCTYFSGNSLSGITAMAVDSVGYAYVTGTVTQNNPNVPIIFPTTAGAYQTTPPPSSSLGSPGFSFVAKLTTDGSSLVYSTLLGASLDVGASAIGVDDAGRAIVAGSTYATDLATTPGALFQCDPSTSWGSQALLLQLSSDGSSLVYSTYLGRRLHLVLSRWTQGVMCMRSLTI
jgi:hypothetical protein